MKGNVINLNTLHLNSVRLNGIGKVQSVSLKGGSTEDPVFPPVEPPVEPEPTPTYTLSASVTNGMVSATRNGSAVNLPYTANEGDVIVLEVTPNDGYEFNGWNDGNTDNPRSITMNADVALLAQCVEVVQPPVGNYIQFEDKAVEAICVANWSSDGIGLTEEDAAAVTSIGTTFKGNTEITSFNELRYFTKVTSLDTSAFEDCSSLRSLDATNIKDIGNYALCNLPLQSLNLYYDAVSTIGTDGLRGLSCLPSSLSMPSLTSVGRGNALRSTNIEEVLDFGGVTEISAYTFYECTNLKVVNIPSTCTSIQAQALAYCYALKKVVCRATTPPELHAQTFMSTNSDFLIYVPDASLEAYKTATNWKQFADRIRPLSEIEGNALGLVSDGNAYIVTDYYPNTYDNVEVEFESPSSSTLQLLLGSRESLSYKNLFVAAIKPSSGGGGYVDRFYSNSTPPYIVTNGRNNIKLQLSSDNEGRLVKDLFMHNDKLMNTFNRSFEPTEYVMPYPLVVFGSNQMNSSAIDTRIFKGTIYFVKITDARSGEVKLYLQPRVVDGVAGMMDTISGTFYTNSNTKGTFIVE